MKIFFIFVSRFKKTIVKKIRITYLFLLFSEKQFKRPTKKQKNFSFPVFPKFEISVGKSFSPRIYFTLREFGIPVRRNSFLSFSSRVSSREFLLTSFSSRVSPHDTNPRARSAPIYSSALSARGFRFQLFGMEASLDQSVGHNAWVAQI